MVELIISDQGIKFVRRLSRTRHLDLAALVLSSSKAGYQKFELMRPYTSGLLQ